MAIEFDSLNQKNSFAIADVTSIKDLQDNLDFLSTKVTVRNKAAFQKRLRESVTTRNAMAVVERLVAYEAVVFDGPGAESHNLSELRDCIPFVEPVPIPNSFYNDVARNVHELETAQIYKEIEQNASQFTSVSPYESFFDQLERRGTLVSTIANTGNTLPRVLFYMLLCDACKAPMLLHPNKDRFLKYISDRCVSEALKTIEDEADRILIGDANDLSKSGVSLPPLAEHIFDFAVDKGISISEAMNDVRESKDAKAFRGWLNEIQICTNDGSRKALLEGRKQLSEFRSVVERWAKNMDVGLDVNHKYAVFGIGISTDAIKERTGIEIKIPDISLKIRDPILNPRRHFKFIASWYKG